jgi:hypothetical protein
MDTNTIAAIANHRTDMHRTDTHATDIETTNRGHDIRVHQRWLWFTEVAGQLAEVEVCDNAACSECAGATPVGIVEEAAAA